MPLASIVVVTLPGMAQAVAERMGRLDGMGPLSAEGQNRVVGTWKVPAGDTPEALSEVLQAMNPEILEVNPLLVEEET